jgi:hypothetical protein
MAAPILISSRKGTFTLYAGCGAAHPVVAARHSAQPPCCGNCPAASRRAGVERPSCSLIDYCTSATHSPADGADCAGGARVLSATSYPQLTTPTSASLPRDPALLSQNGFTTAEDLINYARLCRTFTNGWDKFYASFDTMRSVAAGTPAFLQMFRVASKAWDEEGAPASYAGAAAAAPRSGMGDVNGGQE